MECDVTIATTIRGRDGSFRHGSLRLVSHERLTEVHCTRHDDGYSLVLRIDPATRASDLMAHIALWLQSEPTEAPTPSGTGGLQLA